jgi:hypothetical protein
MSVELIVYPQITSLSQFIVDALEFTTVDTATNTDNASNSNIYGSIMSTAPPTIAGAWYRFRGTVNATAAQATTSGGNLVLNSVVASTANSMYGSGCGVYQQLSGLIIGESYTATINIANAPGYLAVRNQNGQSGVQTSFSASSTTQKVFTFTAMSDSDTLFIAYYNNTADNLVVNNISITGTAGITDWEGQVICDLYEHEEIPLTLSVDDFKNVAEKIQSYSKDFNLPATKRNNKIFGNIFEITRSFGNPYDFNPYARTRSVLKQDGFILFDGFLKLLDIQERDGEISYNVNLYAQTIALADTLKDRTFDFIDFSELEHTYSKVAIKGSWYTDGLPLSNALTNPNEFAGPVGATVTDVLKYPFVDWTGQILIANDATGNNSTDGFPELTSLEQAFRPFIQIKYLIDRIFSEAGYTYTCTLFDTGKFKRLFMDFNWGGDNMPTVIPDTTTTATYPKVQSGVGPPVRSTTTAYITAAVIDRTQPSGNVNSNTPAEYQDTTSPVAADIYKIVNTSDNRFYEIDYSIEFYNNSSDPNTEATLRWAHYVAATGITTTFNSDTQPINANQSETFSGNISRLLNDGDKLYPEFACTSGGGTIKQRIASGPTATMTFNIMSANVTSATLNSLRGEVNQWDFLKGIFTMFNLVTLQDKSDPANIIIETYSDVFIKNTKGTTLKDRSINFDWTDKVDLKDVTLTPLNDLKKRTIFKYEQDDDDYIFNMYRKSTRGHLYGSKVFSAGTLTLLEGEDEIVASPFAATVSKPLGQGFNEMIVPTIYSMNDDGTTSPFDNMPRILYNHTGGSPVAMGSTSYYIPSQNGGSSENSSNFFSFSHLTDIPTDLTSANPTVDYNFGECQYIQPIGQTTPLNLFNTYWFPYYNELYNPDTKTMLIKVNLTAGDIAQFEFSDLCMIKNRSYRVNRIDYKPKDLSTVEFILIG